MNAVAKQQWAQVKYSQTTLGAGVTPQGQQYPGGLDLVTPSLRLQPGAVTDALNFEIAPFGGSTRIAGDERFDGRGAPSDATFTIVQVADFTGIPDFSLADFSPVDFATTGP